MADARDPLTQFLDLALYAPVGVFLAVQRELPQLIAAGRTRVDGQVTLARFLGKVAVSRGRQELERRVNATEDSVRRRAAPAVDARAVEVPPVEMPPVETRASTALTAVDPVAPSSAAPIGLPGAEPTLPRDLPIGGYDSLAASQVVLRLDGLTPDELEQVRLHEVGHRARRTILGKISQLQAR